MFGLIPALGLLATTPALAAGPGPTIRLRTERGREVLVWLWRRKAPRWGTIAFSHGAGSAPWKYPDLVQSWTRAGYDVFAPLHPESPDHPDHAQYEGLASWTGRIEDMRALAHHIDRPHIAVGHSYGALTALVLGGAAAVRPEGVSGSLRDGRAIAVVAFSPPPPIPGLIDRAGYAALAVPALIETGTRDIPPGSADKAGGWRDHLAAYDAAAPGGHRYALVLDGADHYFGGAICDDSKPGPRQTAQLATASDLSLRFMAAWGGRSNGSRSALEAMLGQQVGLHLTSK